MALPEGISPPAAGGDLSTRRRMGPWCPPLDGALVPATGGDLSLERCGRLSLDGRRRHTPTS
ncbi:hypothetical protein ACP70R_032984 [Stipagrostis hirtigluma subsp. patula]